MNSMATGMMPAPMMADTHWPAASLEPKPSSIGRAPSGERRMRTVASVTMPNWPSEPDDQPHQIVAGRIEMGAADVDHLAVHQHHLEAQHVVGGDAVLEAVGAAGVHADVAGQRAGELAEGSGA